MVIGRAIVRDVLTGAEAQRLMWQVTLVFAVAPAVAPVLGGWLHVWFGWRAVFAFLVLFTRDRLGALLAVAAETLPAEQRQPLSTGYLARAYWQVLRTGPFVALSFAVTFNFAAVFLYIVSAPQFLIKQLHVGETGFLWLFGPATIGIVSGAWLSGRAAGRIPRRQTVWWGYGIMMAAALGNLLLNLLVPPGLPWSVLPVGSILPLGAGHAQPDAHGARHFPRAARARLLLPELCGHHRQRPDGGAGGSACLGLDADARARRGVLLAIGLVAFLLYLRLIRGSAPPA